MTREYLDKLVSIEDAVKVIRSGDRVAASTGVAFPFAFFKELSTRKEELRDVTIFTQLLLGQFDWLTKDFIGHIHLHSSFLGGMERKFLNDGNITWYSYPFSRTNRLLSEHIRPTVFVATASLPDENGNMSFSAMGSVWAKKGCELADRVIVQVNKKAPFVYGGEDSYINVSDVECVFETDDENMVFGNSVPGPDDEKIASLIVPYIKDGSTIQLGIGNVAGAVGFGLLNHKHLGVHSEMFTDSMMALAKAGVLDNSMKSINKGKATFAFAMGTNELYDFIDHNEMTNAREINYVANPFVIAQHDNFVSINSCLACDLTGQVGSESLGFNQFSATGGQLDFVRGARLSEGGRAFLCMNSVVKKKDGTMVSKISTALPPGTAITTPRTDVDCVVTEYGVADLRYLDFEARAKAMIEIAHPDFREQLYNEAVKNGLIHKKI